MPQAPEAALIAFLHISATLIPLTLKKVKKECPQSTMLLRRSTKERKTVFKFSLKYK